MFSLPTTALIVSIVVFLILIVGVQKERRRGRRFFAIKFRAWLDKKVTQLGEKLITSWNHFVKYILQLHWYYSIHTLLRTILSVITAFYSYVENVFERNRSRTKQLRAEKRKFGKLSHLGQVAVHKEDVSLTPAQKVKLRHKKLEEKH